ncbi:MAG: AIR synthase related protein [Desulfurococcales archaeon]|nr:AIR synthase related protein [Desulfurococcales archaeon]
MGEHEFAEWLVDRLGVPNADAFSEGGLILKVDGYSASEALYPWMTLKDLGWKAVTSAVSDVYASGGVPVFYLVSIGANGEGEARDLMSGVIDAVEFYGGRLVGGDTNKCKGDKWIDVFVLGKSLSGRLISREGARPGDAVVQVGEAGLGSAAYIVYSEGLNIDEFPRVKRWSVRPVVPSWVPRVVSHQCVSAVIDNSDGFYYSLRSIGVASGVRLVVDRVVFDGEAVRVVGGDWPRLSVGEDYNLFMTVRPGCLESFLDWCRGMSGGWFCGVIGRVEGGSPGVSIAGYSGGGGWRSF